MFCLRFNEKHSKKEFFLSFCWQFAIKCVTLATENENEGLPCGRSKAEKKKLTNNINLKNLANGRKKSSGRLETSFPQRT